MTASAPQRDLIDINKENLYDVLGVSHDATVKEINRSYRKKALKLHPDKNPDPAAHKMFLKMTQILELLTDKESRENYDTILKAREAAKLRTQQLDAKRRKLKESLESKESGDTSGVSLQKAKRSLQETIKKLQAEGESLMRREEEKLREEFTAKTQFIITDKATLKLKWKCKKDDLSNGGYCDKILRQLLQKYGPISDIVLNSKRKGSALVVFDSIAAAKICMQKETGLEQYPLSFRMIHETDSTEMHQHVPTNQQNDSSKSQTFTSFQPHESGKFSSFPCFSATSNSTRSNTTMNNAVDRDYESLTLMRLRQAEERKKLIEEIQRDEERSNNSDENG
ncbi:hypothetical protein ACHWQZ_G003645 [Mnemiopsis leidyi]